MKLYPKKLNNTTELKTERQLLKLELARIDPDGVLSLDVRNKEKSAPTEKKSDAGMLGDLLGAGSIMDIALKVLPLITGGKKNIASEKTGPNILVKVAIEFVGGYLKWKAIELSYKGLKKAFRSKKVE